MTPRTRAGVAALIDHTLLKPEATAAEVAQVVTQAHELGVKAVCVSPTHLPLAAPDTLTVATVCGFPSGQHQPQVKALEARVAGDAGAHEVDMVANLAAIAAGDWVALAADIAAVRSATNGVLLKVILETALWSPEVIEQCCRVCLDEGADFVKTSTGFHPAGGASVLAVATMAGVVQGRLGVKASGGIRTSDQALAMIDAGATRLGLSASAAVLADLP